MIGDSPVKIWGYGVKNGGLWSREWANGVKIGGSPATIEVPWFKIGASGARIGGLRAKS